MESSMFLPVLILVVSFTVMLVLNTQIAVAIALSTLLTLWSVSTSVPIPADVVVAQRMASGMESFALLAIPMFIVSGMLLGRGGMARRIMDFAASIMSVFPGGLALANVLACMLFGSISGAAAAAVSSIGGFMIPEMNRKNYPPEFSVGVTVTAATTGLLIPPSNIMIVYAMAAGGISITSLFLGGVIPGIITGLCLMATAMIICIIKGYGRIRKDDGTFEDTPRPPVVRSFINALPALSIGIVVLLGILMGWFTATEAAAVAVVLSFIFAVWVYREVKMKDVGKIMFDSAITSSVVLLLIGTSSAMSWVLSFVDIPQAITAGLLEFSQNKWTILIIINIILLLVGTFMDMTPAVLIFTPIFLPIVTDFGIDPVHFGIIMVANLCVGLCTPPVGTCIFIGCSVGKTKLMQTTLAILPFCLAMLVALAIIVAFPALTTWLPSLQR